MLFQANGRFSRLFPENSMKKLRGIWGIIIALLVVVSVPLGAYVFSADASVGPSSAGLNTLAGYGIANETSAVFLLNDSGSTVHWIQATFTVNKPGNSITITVPPKDKISQVIVQTKNISQDVYDLLQHGALFTYTELTITGAVNTNLTSAYMYFGVPINATSTNSIGDKGITDYAMTQPLYDEQASYFGSSIQLNPVTYMASSFSSTAQYQFNLNESKNATGSYTTFTMAFQQYFQYTTGQEYPLVTAIASIALVILVFAIYITYLAAPAYDGGEEERAKAFQTRKEIGIAAVGIAGAIGILIIEGFVGTLTPLGGWGAAIASLFFFGLFIFAYTEIPQRQKYSRTMGIGLIGMVVGLIVNMFWPFGSMVYNFMVSPNVVALIYGWLAVVFFLVIAYYGLIDTKRYRLRRRDERRERSAKRLKG